MISLEELRKIEPKCKDLSDEELLKLRANLYEMAELALERYFADLESKKV